MTDPTLLSEKLLDSSDIRPFLDGMFFHLPLACAAFRPDGELLEVNAGFRDLLLPDQPRAYRLAADTRPWARTVAHLLERVPAEGEVRVPLKWYAVGQAPPRALVFDAFPLRDPQSQLRYIVVSCRDATEESTARERAEAERDRFRSLFVSMLDGMVLLERDSTVVEANPAAALLLGLSVEDLLGQRLRDFAFDGERAAAAWSTLLAEGELRGEGVLQRRDGGLCEVEYECQSEFAPGYFLVILRDITVKKSLESEQQRLEAQLRQAQKLEAIGRLAGSVAHDFNNLLTVINGYSELLLTDMPDSAAEAMLQIYHAGQQAAALTNQLLAFGRKSLLKPARLELNTVILRLAKMLRRLLPEDIEIDLQLAAHLDQVLIDPSQFEQIVMNLVLNARDAMPHGGLLLIKTLNLELDGPYDRTHAGLAAGRYVMLTVSDNGVGMDAHTCQQVFEPFYTTKHDGQGTGLGLSTVHGIVRQSGGQIFVYSEPAHGTSFKLYFPALTPEDAQRPSPKAEPPMPEGKETVFLAEDMAEVRDFIRLVLESCGYRVVTSPGGQQAEAAFADIAAECRLLITDVIMPCMSGPQLAERLRQQQPALRVLYISGYTDDAVLRYGILTSGIPFLAKPFTPGQLALKVREVLDAD